MSTLRTENLLTNEDFPNIITNNAFSSIVTQDIIQLVQGGSFGTNVTSTTVWQTSHTATLTKKLSSSIIFIFCNYVARIESSGTRMRGRLRRTISGQSTTIWEHNSISFQQPHPGHGSFMLFDQVASTSSVTYSFDILSNNGNLVRTDDAGATAAGFPNTLILMEFAPFST